MNAIDEAEEDEEHKGEELEEILHRIQDYHGLWKFIGIELGIDIDVLNTIEKDYRQDIDCLHALIIRLPHGDDSSLTCKALVEAFQSERVSDAKAGRYISSNNIRVLPVTKPSILYNSIAIIMCSHY